MIKSIIFDFDGVILESADIKTDAFSELFARYPGKQKAIVDFHLANAGISRYIKFKHIYENILKEKLTEQKEKELGERFTEIVFEKILKAPFVSGAKEFLESNFTKYKLFIASGTPEEELFLILEKRDLKKYFAEVHGSPNKKSDIINNVMKKYGFEKNEVLYVGDALSDRKAAEATGVFFAERKAGIDKDRLSSFVVKDLSNLTDAVNLLNKGS
jgi:HAD superfamily hydrolase (TIGR01549 family)